MTGSDRSDLGVPAPALGDGGPPGARGERGPRSGQTEHAQRPPVALRIDALVLRGVAPADAPGFARALHDELARRLAEPGFAAGLRGDGGAALSASALRLQVATPAAGRPWRAEVAGRDAGRCLANGVANGVAGGPTRPPPDGPGGTR